MGRRGLPGDLRNRAEWLPRACARRGPRRLRRPGRCGRRHAPIGARAASRTALDTDSNCTDFLLQPATTLSAASAAGATNIKVASVADFAAGQTIMIDTGANLETAVIATVGTAGATTVGAATNVGATVIPVASGFGFTRRPDHHDRQWREPGDGGCRLHAGGRGGRGGAGATITVAAPLTLAHAAGAQVSGTGITLTAALTQAHASGAQVASDVPTPGAPNKYYRRRN